MIALAIDLARSRRMLIIGIIAGLLGTSIGYLALYPSFEDQLAVFADDLPDAYRALLGDADISTPEGYVRSQVYSLIAPLIMAGAAISAGSGLAKAERDFTLAQVVVSPLHRRQVAGAWWLVVFSVSIAGAVAVVVGVAIGGPLAGASVPLDRVVVATIPLLLFAVLIGTIALLIAATTGAPGLATGGSWAVVAISFIASSFGELVDRLSWLAQVSPWSWHGAGEAITARVNGTGTALLLAVTAGLGASALLSFKRRNLHL